MTDIARRCMSEAFGTAALILIGPGAVMVDSLTNGGIGILGIAVAFAAVVTAVVASTGHISGAHINPAVTIGLWWAGRHPRAEVVPYVVAQVIGAIVGAGMLKAALGDVARIGGTFPSLTVDRALGVEVVLSLLLVLVILGATGKRSAPGNAPLAIGITVGFCALVGGPLTGASMNPARSFGPALLASDWTAHWVYWIGPLVGSGLAVALYSVLEPVVPEAEALPLRAEM